MDVPEKRSSIAFCAQPKADLTGVQKTKTKRAISTPPFSLLFYGMEDLLKGLLIF